VIITVNSRKYAPKRGVSHGECCAGGEPKVYGVPVPGIVFPGCEKTLSGRRLPWT
jgi:hypothetical protein